MFSSSRHLRSRLTSRALTIALAATAFVALSVTPPVGRWLPGPTPQRVAYLRERARAQDLQRQVTELTAKLERPRPIECVGRCDIEIARADDLKAQVEALEDKLGIPRPPDQSARANDLQARLRDAEAKLRAPHPNPGDPEAVARADDLKRQTDDLAAQLARPRPPIDPLAGVTASLTRDQIASADHLFGLYTEQAPFDYAEVNLVQAAVGRKANIVGYFQAWTTDFRPDAVKQTWSRGQIPLLTWEPQSQVGAIAAVQPDFALSTIIGGAHDDYIRRYAQAIAATRLPLILRFAHEMNGTWYPWSENVNGNQDGEFAKAWRHVHDIFETEGANRYTVWLWSPNRINQIPNRPDPAAFYPGDDVVDWIGMSGYYREYDDSDLFAETYGRTLPLLRAASPDKPILLSEIGATETGNHKADWIDNLFGGLAANPDIIGFAWFNLTVTATVNGTRRTNDWRINSSGGPVAEMTKLLATSGLGTAP